MMTRDELTLIRNTHGDLHNNMKYVWTPVGLQADIHREKLLQYVDDLLETLEIEREGTREMINGWMKTQSHRD